MATKKLTYEVLRVDLTKGTTKVEQLEEATVRTFLGGSGFAAKTLWEETDAKTEPLSEENLLIFSVGPATATAIPSCSRLIVSTIGAQTNIWGEGHAGGTFASLLRRSGFMAIVIKGKAPKPVYIWVKNGEAKIGDASNLWGKDTYETYDILRERLDPKASVACIGQAGEKLVRIAAIMVDGPEAHAAARCGVGAVMGFKNLKAVVASGGRKPEVFDDEGLKKSVNKIYPKLYDPTPGVPSFYKMLVGMRYDRRCAVKNFQDGTFDAFRDVIVNHNRKWATGTSEFHPCMHCRNCCVMPIFQNGKKVTHGESNQLTGSNCYIADLEPSDRAFEMANRQGVDTISLGDIIAFGMELYERGIITKKDTDGIELTFGNGEAMVEMSRKIIYNEGFGKILGQGVKKAAEIIGGLAPEAAVHVKGLEFSLHDIRSWNTYALQVATGNRGGDHMDGFVGLYEQGMYPGGQAPGYGFTHIDDENAKLAYYDPFARKGVGKLVAWSQNFTNMIDSLVTCFFIGSPIIWIKQPAEKFDGVQPEEIAEWLNYLTGWEWDEKEVMKIGERAFNLKRLFNVRRGISRKDDFLPPRMMTHPRGGILAEAYNIPPIGEMLHEYYEARGWDEFGVPTKEKLAALDIPYRL